MPFIFMNLGEILVDGASNKISFVKTLPVEITDKYKVCRVTHIARVWINRVRLPILLVVS